MPDLESVTESDAASTVEDYHYDPEAGWQAAGPLTPDEQAQWWAQFDAVPGVQGTPGSDSLGAAPGVQDTPDSDSLTVALPLTDNEFLHVTYVPKAEHQRPVTVIGSSRRLQPRHLAGVAVPRQRQSEPPLEAVEGLGATVGEIAADLRQNVAGVTDIGGDERGDDTDDRPLDISPSDDAATVRMKAVRSAEGGQQGCVLATNRCCLPYQKALRKTQRKYPKAEFVIQADDTSIRAASADAENVHKALKANRKALCNTVSNVKKVKYFRPGGGVEGIPAEQFERQGGELVGLKLVGVYLAPDTEAVM